MDTPLPPLPKRSSSEELALPAQRRLSSAAASGNFGTVKEVLESSRAHGGEHAVDIDARDKDGFTLLHRACAIAENGVVEMLLSHGVNPNLKDDFGDAPLHWACFCGNVDAVKALLAGGANPGIKSDDGKTALDAALEEYNEEVIGILSECGLFSIQLTKEGVMLEGALKVQTAASSILFSPWSSKYCVVSSTARKLFLWKGKAKTENEDDITAFRFSDILRVKGILEKKYPAGRRIDVYVRIDRGVLDDADADGEIFPAVRSRRVSISRGPSRSKAKQSAILAQAPVTGKGRAMSARFVGLFDAKQVSNLRRVDSSTRDATSICVRLLAETPQLGRQFGEALTWAAMQGKSFPACMIQALWRGWKARRNYAKLVKKIAAQSRIVKEKVGRRPVSMRLTSPQNRDSFGSFNEEEEDKALSGEQRADSDGSRGRSRTAAAIELHEGPLKKQTSSGLLGLLKMWKQRYFLIDYENGCLRYFHSKKQRDKLGAIKISKKQKLKNVFFFSTFLRVTTYESFYRSKKNKLRFVLRMTGKGNDLKLEAGSEAQVEAWIQNLKAVLPRENVAALDIQRVFRGHLARRLVTNKKESRKKEKIAEKKKLEKERIQAEYAQRLIDEENKRKEKEEKARKKKEAEAAAAARAKRQRRLAAMKAMKEKKAREEAERAKAVAEAAAKAAAEAAAKAIAEKPPPAPSTGEWESAVDAATGKTYYFNNRTGETTWTKPEGLGGEDEGGQEDEEEWVKRFDPATGHAYWENRATKETRWTNPNAEGEWEKHIDPKTGNAYYSNTSTGEVTWVRPGDYKSDGEDDSDDDDDESLPDPWETHYDGEGRAYYHNPATGETTWIRPKVDTGVGSATSDAFLKGIVDKVLRTMKGSASKVEEEVLTACAQLQEDPQNLFRLVSAGFLLCDLLFCVAPDAIDLRVVNRGIPVSEASRVKHERADSILLEQTHVLENCNLCINAAKSAGCELDASVTPAALCGLTTRTKHERAVIDFLTSVFDLQLSSHMSIRNCRYIATLARHRAVLLEDVEASAYSPSADSQGDDDAEEKRKMVERFERLPTSSKLLRWMDYHVERSTRKNGKVAAALRSSETRISFGCKRAAENEDEATLAFVAHVGLVTSRVGKKPPSELLLQALQGGVDGDLRKELIDELSIEVASAARALGADSFIADPEILKSGGAHARLACAGALFMASNGLEDGDDCEDDGTLSVSSFESGELEMFFKETDAGESREERMYRLWLNSLKVGEERRADKSPEFEDVLHISNIFADFKDGVKLLRILDKLGGNVNWKRVNKSPRNRYKMIENANYVLELGRHLGFTLVNIGPFDIIDGNEKLLLALMWQMMRHHTLQILAKISGDGDGEGSVKNSMANEEDILVWANRRVAAALESGAIQRQVPQLVEGCDPSIFEPIIESFRSSSLWSSCFLLVLLDGIYPGIVKWKLVEFGSVAPGMSTEDVEASEEAAFEKNAKYAIALSQKINCLVFLTWEDIVEVKSKLIMVLVASLMLLSSARKR